MCSFILEQFSIIIIAILGGECLHLCLWGWTPFVPAVLCVNLVATCTQNRHLWIWIYPWISTQKKSVDMDMDGKFHIHGKPARSSAGSRPPLSKFSGYVEVEARYIFHPSTIWVRPLFRAEKTPKADFAMKQTNICRLSGDIITSFSGGNEPGEL